MCQRLPKVFIACCLIFSFSCIDSSCQALIFILVYCSSINLFASHPLHKFSSYSVCTEYASNEAPHLSHFSSFSSFSISLITSAASSIVLFFIVFKIASVLFCFSNAQAILSSAFLYLEYHLLKVSFHTLFHVVLPFCLEFFVYWNHYFTLLCKI